MASRLLCLGIPTMLAHPHKTQQGNQMDRRWAGGGTGPAWGEGFFKATSETPSNEDVRLWTPLPPTNMSPRSLIGLFQTGGPSTTRGATYPLWKDIVKDLQPDIKYTESQKHLRGSSNMRDIIDVQGRKMSFACPIVACGECSIPSPHTSPWSRGSALAVALPFAKELFSTKHHPSRLQKLQWEGNACSGCIQTPPRAVRPLSSGGTRQLTALGSCRLCCADGEQHFLSSKMEILCSRVTADLASSALSQRDPDVSFAKKACHESEREFARWKVRNTAIERRDLLHNPLPLMPEFQRSIRLLGRRPTTQQFIDTIIKKYGTHILISATLGGEEALTMYMDKSRLDRKSGNATQSVEALHQLASSYFVDRDGTMRRLHEIQISTGAIKVTETRTGPLGCNSYDNLDSVSNPNLYQTWHFLISKEDLYTSERTNSPFSSVATEAARTEVSNSRAFLQLHDSKAYVKNDCT
ncbi:Deleted in bladder cancer protein 1-like protein [Anas platyrhynchos]|uniref:BMP/retinoic acid-inducible neural-specific protein 1 n=1 Tax=Anas platyrhynchos TaxID=8839 RepID=R0LA40_ANAPL|nr:Deleted in bladder cancer protein 1-like protein [Anas platyrhynchos]